MDSLLNTELEKEHGSRGAHMRVYPDTCLKGCGKAGKEI
jgi:hypothetical protein